MVHYHAGSPMERVHIDISGPFNMSSRGNKYILCMVDQFTKWLESFICLISLLKRLQWQLLITSFVLLVCHCLYIRIKERISLVMFLRPYVISWKFVQEACQPIYLCSYISSVNFEINFPQCKPSTLTLISLRLVSRGPIAKKWLF